MAIYALLHYSISPRAGFEDEDDDEDENEAPFEGKGSRLHRIAGARCVKSDLARWILLKKKGRVFVQTLGVCFF
jgi:hypothetical protein